MRKLEQGTEKLIKEYEEKYRREEARMAAVERERGEAMQPK